MPELPEVETVRTVLAPHLANRKITGVQIRNPQVIAAPDPQQFAENILNQTIEKIERRGKYLRFIFAGGDRMTVHLRMTGCLLIEPHDAPPAKYSHVLLALNDGKDLRYEDVRRLGKFWFSDRDEPDASGAEKLGIEPFSGLLTAQYLRGKCATAKRSVKQMLLDQGIVAGIGNIYSDEILFSARIRPDRPCNTLTEKEFERLAEIIPERLQFFIEKNKINFDDYVRSKGKEYRNTPYLQVYGKAGCACPICGSVLQHIVLAGRSSVFCMHCQK